MVSRFIAVYRNPADRRKWLTIASGLFITVVQSLPGFLRVSSCFTTDANAVV